MIDPLNFYSSSTSDSRRERKEKRRWTCGMKTEWGFVPRLTGQCCRLHISQGLFRVQQHIMTQLTVLCP